MHQKDIECFAFLFLCGKRDRAILTGKEKMTFSDLNRLIYLLDYLGLDAYSLEIWSEYGGQFKDQLEQLKEIYDETAGIVSWDPAEEDERQEQWIREFCGRCRIETAGNCWKNYSVDIQVSFPIVQCGFLC